MKATKTVRPPRTPAAKAPRNDAPPTPAPLEKIVWALDPFAADAAAEARPGKVLAALQRCAPGLRVAPVYVVPTPEDAVLGTQPLDPRAPWCQRTLERIAGVAKAAKLSPAGKPKLVAQPGHSLHAAVLELVQHARAEKASAIAVGTHSRRGAARWFLGSFAETLLLSSPLPVLVVNPKTVEPKKFQRLLFPTDFSDGSREAFTWIRALARQLDAELHLFHRSLLDRDPARQPFDPPAVPEALWLRLQEGRLAAGRRWLEEAKAAGLKAELHVSRHRASVAEAASAAAKRLSASAIVLSSHGHAIAGRLLGSVARQLVRDAPCPVLVVPPRRG
jgi:nucleotide-binding universal stress UspA family protein